MVDDPDELDTALRPTRPVGDEAPRRTPSLQAGPVLIGVLGGDELRPTFEVHPVHADVTVIGRAAVDGGIQLPRDDEASRLHATLLCDGDNVTLTNDSQNGTFRNGVRAGAKVPLSDGDVVRTGSSVFVFRSRWEAGEDGEVPTLLGESHVARSLRHQVRLLADSDARVMLLGETGTGKEVVARALHEHSGRSGPFVAVNCGAIPSGLAESALFGHKKGSFTGATEDQQGYFERADGGTLFLDELGELPYELQAKLLRTLDGHTVTRLGETRERKLDVRVLSATNRDLDEELETGGFRADLFARLSDISLTLPPLRDRREDVLRLLGAALGEPFQIDPALATALLTHAWRFNVRELFKVAKELSVRGAGRGLLTLDLVSGRLATPDDDKQAPPAWVTAPAPAPEFADASEPAPEVVIAPRAVPSRLELEALLVRHAGNVVRIAKETGRSRRAVYRWVEHHGLVVEDYRPEDGGES